MATQNVFANKHRTRKNKKKFTLNQVDIYNRLVGYVRLLSDKLTVRFRGCLHGGGPGLLVGLALFPEIPRLSKILCQNLFSFI